MDAAYGSDEYWKRCISAAEAQASRDRKNFDKYLKMFRHGQFDDAQAAEMNLTFMYLSVVSSALFAQAPTVDVDAQDGGGGRSFAPVVQVFGGMEQAREAYADGIERLLSRSAEETEQQAAAEAVIQGTILTGLGWTKVGFDPERGVPVTDALSRMEVYIDPAARYSLRQGQYALQTCVKPYDQAVEFFNAMGMQIGAPNWQMNSGEGYASDERKLDAKDATRDQFKFYEIWCKHGNERVIEYRAYRADEPIGQREWPFGLPGGDFPFVPLAFNRQYIQVCDPFTELDVVDGLRQIVNQTTEFFRRQTQRGLGKVMLLNPKYFSAEAQKVIQNGKDFEVIRAEEEFGAAGDAFVVVDLNSADDPTPEKGDKFKSFWEQILGIDQLLSGANVRGMTAEEASIREQAFSNRLAKRQGCVDAWQTRINRTCAQVARQLTPAEIVAQLVGEEAGLLWSLYDGDAEAFAREYVISVQAGSSGERHRQQVQQRLQQWAVIAAGANQAQPLGPQFNLHEIAIDIAKAQQMRNPQKYEIQPANPSPPAPLPASGVRGEQQQQIAAPVPGGITPPPDSASAPVAALHPQVAQMRSQLTR